MRQNKERVPMLTVPREEANRGVYMQEMEKKVSVLLYLHK